MFLSGFTHPGQSLLAAILLIGFLPWSAVSAGRADMEYDVVCSAGPGTDHRSAAEVCEEFLQLLRSAYPDQRFLSAASDSEGRPRLDLVISQASRSATALQLVWTDLQGVKREGRIESVSAMDRQLSSSMRQSLYRRALMASPLPE